MRHAFGCSVPWCIVRLRLNSTIVPFFSFRAADLSSPSMPSTPRTTTSSRASREPGTPSSMRSLSRTPVSPLKNGEVGARGRLLCVCELWGALALTLGSHAEYTAVFCVLIMRRLSDVSLLLTFYSSCPVSLCLDPLPLLSIILSLSSSLAISLALWVSCLSLAISPSFSFLSFFL